MTHNLAVEVSRREGWSFADGEHKARPLVSVRSKDGSVAQSLHASPEAGINDTLCKLLIFLSTVGENGAARITAPVPYLAYARNDRHTKAHDPVTMQYVARLFEPAGANCVVTLDVHDIVAFQNAFRCRAVHLDTRAPFARNQFGETAERPLVVASPDSGGAKRVQMFREMLERRPKRLVGQALADQRRSADVVSGDPLAGDVDGAAVIVIDDLITSDGTMARASDAGDVCSAPSCK